MLEKRAEQIVILFPEVFLYLLKGAQRTVLDISFSLFGLVYFPFFLVLRFRISSFFKPLGSHRALNPVFAYTKFHYSIEHQKTHVCSLSPTWPYFKKSTPNTVLEKIPETFRLNSVTARKVHSFSSHSIRYTSYAMKKGKKGSIKSRQGQGDRLIRLRGTPGTQETTRGNFFSFGSLIMRSILCAHREDVVNILSYNSRLILPSRI